MSATAAGLLNVCRGELGYREGRNNDNKYGIWYGWNNVPYCAIGLTWAGAQAGATSILHGRFAYCPYWVDAFRAAGEWHQFADGAMPGDLVFFDWSGHHTLAEHVGIVESVDSDVLVTIEFNTGDVNQSDGQGVFRRRRSALNVVGYGRPAYSPQTRPVPLPSRSGRQAVPLVIDGVWGPKTTGHLQLWLATTPTGVVDQNLRKRLQARLGVTVDGIWGPITRRKLQQLVGVSTDGIWGPITVTHFQRFLNTVA